MAYDDSDRDARDRRTHALFCRARAAAPDERRRIEDRIIVEHVGLADAIARRLAHGTNDWNDLRQVGCVGLIKACRRFDPEVGASFVAFASPTIGGEIKRHLRDNGWMIRPPRRLQELHVRLPATRETARHELGREPSRSDVAAMLDVTVAELAEAEGCSHPLSLDLGAEEAGGFTETLGALDPRLAAVDARDGLADALGRLTARDREVLLLRFAEDWTQQRIAARFGMTQMQVSRLLRRMLAQLGRDLGVVDASEAGDPSAADERAIA